MLRVAVIGALGNMGREVTRAVAADPELELACLVDPAARSDDTSEGIVVAASIDSLEGARVDVGVDFTHAAAAVDNILWAEYTAS
jgi:dihydrodipicolinate reductase